MNESTHHIIMKKSYYFQSEKPVYISEKARVAHHQLETSRVMFENQEYVGNQNPSGENSTTVESRYALEGSHETYDITYIKRVTRIRETS